LFFLCLASSDMALEDSAMGGGPSGQAGGRSGWGHDALSQDGDGKRGGEHSKTTVRGGRIRTARHGPLGRLQSHRDGRLAKHCTMPTGALHLGLNGHMKKSDVDSLGDFCVKVL
jgi:hypothetical protein